MALFEVWKDGKRKMYTDSENCIYPIGVLLQMKDAGFDIRYQGKRYTPRRSEGGPLEQYRAQLKRK